MSDPLSMRPFNSDFAPGDHFSILVIFCLQCAAAAPLPPLVAGLVAGLCHFLNACFCYVFLTESLLPASLAPLPSRYRPACRRFVAGLCHLVNTCFCCVFPTESFWEDSGKPQASVWEASEKRLGSLRKASEKPLGNLWEASGKLS